MTLAWICDEIVNRRDLVLVVVVVVGGGGGGYGIPSNVVQFKTFYVI